MSRIRLFIISLLSICYLVAFSQSNSDNIKVEWEEKQNYKVDAALSNILGEIDNELFILKLESSYISASTITIEKYDKNLKLVSTSRISLIDGNKYKKSRKQQRIGHMESL